MKRGRAEILLLITTTEDAGYYCYTACLDTFNEQELKDLHQSLPSEREKKGVPGCLSPYDTETMYDKSVWTHVKEDDVPALENVGKVVLAYAYE